MSEATSVPPDRRPTAPLCSDDALPRQRAPRPALRALAHVHPGVRLTLAQIDEHAARWRTEAQAAIDAGGPLLVALGDSTALGVGARSVDEGYVAKVFVRRPSDAAPLRLVNLAVSGARIADVRRVQLPVLAALGPRVQVVTCSVGANDLVRSPDPVRPVVRLRALFDELATGSATVAVATLPVARASISGRVVNAALRREATARGLRVADLQRHASAPRRDALAPDRFHPSARAYDDWASAFAEALGW